MFGLGLRLCLGLRFRLRGLGLIGFRVWGLDSGLHGFGSRVCLGSGLCGLGLWGSGLGV